MDDDTRWTNSNSVLIAIMAVVAGLNSLVLSSDLNDGLRYALSGVGVVILLLCVYRLSRTTFKR